MVVHRNRTAGWLSGAAGVLEYPDQFLLLRVDAHHRLPCALVLFCPDTDVTELLITVGMLFAFKDLGVACRLKPSQRSGPVTLSGLIA